MLFIAGFEQFLDQDDPVYNNLILDQMSRFFKPVYRFSSQVDFVLILERLDESLILMAREFGWSIADLLYLGGNKYIQHVDIPKSIRQKLLAKSPHDSQLYQFASEKLDQKAKLMNTNPMNPYPHSVDTLQSSVKHLQALQANYSALYFIAKYFLYFEKLKREKRAVYVKMCTQGGRTSTSSSSQYVLSKSGRKIQYCKLLVNGSG